MRVPLALQQHTTCHWICPCYSPSAPAGHSQRPLSCPARSCLHLLLVPHPCTYLLWWQPWWQPHWESHVEYAAACHSPSGHDYRKAPHGTARHLMAPHGTTWHHLAPHGTSWHLMAPHGTAWHVIAGHRHLTARLHQHMPADPWIEHQKVSWT